MIPAPFEKVKVCPFYFCYSNDPKPAKAKEDSYSGMRQRKLVTEAMVKPVGYDVHNVHISWCILGTKCTYDQLVFLVFVYILTSFNH